MAVPIRSAKLPIVAQLLDYRHDWLKLDLGAGLSVAALSLPSAIAYPAIAGLPTEVGFFATILALAAYAMFGPSRQLIVGPDAATCIMLASVLTSLGAATAADRVTFTTVLAVEVGNLCFVAGALGLGFVANFHSRPILVGFLAGISITRAFYKGQSFYGLESTAIYRGHALRPHRPQLSILAGLRG
jgi:sulfate permease, SulP family